MYPILALSPVRLGATVAVGSAAVGLYLVGRILGNVVGGKLTAQRGSPRSAVWALGLLAIAALVCAASTSVVPFMVGALLAGVGHAAVHVSRQAQVMDIVPKRFLARGLTTLAGTWRIGNFVGPLVGAGVIAASGLRGAYVFAAVMIAAGAMSLLVTASWRNGVHHTAAKKVSIRAVVRENKRVLVTLGVAAGLTSAVRTARLIALPLWAEHIGLGDGTASAIFSISAGVDMLLFYPAGVVMDRWGRRWTAIPSTLIVAVAIALLPFTQGAGTLAVLAVLAGLGNGWGSGLLMTLSTDVGPAHGRPVFTAAWMTMLDLGGLAAPVVVSVGAVISLATGMYAVGALGLVATALLHRFIPPWRLEGE